MKNKNILMLCSSMEKGGAERVISLLLKEYQKINDVNIHFIQMEEGLDYAIPQEITPIILSESQKSGIRKLIELPFVAYKILKYVKTNNIDIIISFLYRPNYINILAKLFGANHQAIINIRSTTSRYLKEGLLGKVNLFLIRNLFNKADLIVSNSKGVDEDLKEVMNITTSTKVIHNPIDIEYINSKKEVCEDIEFDFIRNKKYIISVGRLIALKRNKDLVDAFYKLQKNDDCIELIFLGDGPLMYDLRDKCKNLCIEKKVHFLGSVINPFYYLNKSDFFVLNSETEGFPNVLLEAMACGLPVISSDCRSGPREILKNEKYGLLYPVGDIDILIEKMKFYLYSKVDLESIIRKNAERVKDFEIKKIMQQFKEVI